MDDHHEADPPTAPRRISTLAVTATTALYEADLIEEMALLRSRVLNRGARALLDEVRGPEGTREVHYKPMVELLLLHVRDLALSTRPVEDRRTEILWAIETAGF